MAVMPLVPETKMAEVSKLISLGNLFARKTTWLVLTTTSATPISSCVFGAYFMTRIVYKYFPLPTPTLFHIFTYRVNTLFLFLHLTSDMKMYTPSNHSLPCYTLSVRLFPASNTEISSNHRKKQTVEILSQHA